MTTSSSAKPRKPSLTAAPPRLEPPPELGEIEAQEFRRAVAAVPIDHFQAEDVPLLCAYARAVTLERRAAEELAAAATIGSAPSPWLAVHSQMVRAVMALTVRLRIGPRSRAPTNRRATATGQQAPSAYDEMERFPASSFRGFR